MISKIYDNNQILFKVGSKKGKSKKELDDLIDTFKIPVKHQPKKGIPSQRKQKLKRLAKKYGH